METEKKKCCIKNNGPVPMAIDPVSYGVSVWVYILIFVYFLIFCGLVFNEVFIQTKTNFFNVYLSAIFILFGIVGTFIVSATQLIFYEDRFYLKSETRKVSVDYISIVNVYRFKMMIVVEVENDKSIIIPYYIQKNSEVLAELFNRIMHE